MNRAVTRFIRTLPAIVRNTHLNISLSGWPATVAILGACGTAAWVAWVSMKTPEEPQQIQPAKKLTTQQKQGSSTAEKHIDHEGGDSQNRPTF